MLVFVGEGCSSGCVILSIRGKTSSKMARGGTRRRRRFRRRIAISDRIDRVQVILSIPIDERANEICLDSKEILRFRRSRQIAGRSGHDPSRPIVIVSMGVRGGPFEKWDPLASYNTERSAYYREHRMIMENPMYVNEPGYRYIMQNDGNRLMNRIGPNDQPMPRGKRIRSGWWTDLEIAKQDDHGIRMQRRRGDSSNEHASELFAREPNVRIPGQRNKHSSPLADLFQQPYYISRGKKTNYPVIAENDDDDGDYKSTESFESEEQDDHLARKRPESSTDGTTLANKLMESQRYYIHPGKRTHRPSGTESTESV